jgi:uncharacterized protein involved in exopolysaccharide biosynthesis
MQQNQEGQSSPEWDDEDKINLLDFAFTISENIRLLVLGPMIAGLLILAFSFAISPTFTAITSIMPPITRSNSASQLLDSLGSLGAVAGGGLGLSDPSQQYIAYIQSSNFEDLLIEKYGLQKRYEQISLKATRKVLKSNIEVISDRKSGLITIEVSDKDPRFAALLANGLVAELRLFTGRLELQETQNRREFFEAQIKEITSRPFMDAISQQLLITSMIRQYELAKVDEGRVGPTFMQVDVATVPEFKSKPKRGLMAIITTLSAGFALLLFVFIRNAWRNAKTDPCTREQIVGIGSNLRSLWIPSRWINSKK